MALFLNPIGSRVCIVLDDKTPRWMIDLRMSTVQRGRLQTGEMFIQITAPDNETSVKVMFKTQDEFQRWGVVFVESIKSDEEIYKTQVLEPQQRAAEEQKRLDELQEIQSKKTAIISQRKAFKKSAKQLYLGKFLNLYREKPWEEDKKKVVIQKLEQYQQKITWYLSEVKGGVQAFTSQRGVDFSVMRIVTDNIDQSIFDNKIEPSEPTRNMIPGWAILGFGLGGLAITM